MKRTQLESQHGGYILHRVGTDGAHNNQMRNGYRSIGLFSLNSTTFCFWQKEEYTYKLLLKV